MPAADSTRAREAGMLVIILGLLAAVLPASPQWLALAGMSAAASVGVPLLLVDRPALAARLLPAAVVLVALVTGGVAYARATSTLPARDRVHDGGVLVTRAAARDLLHARSPYSDDFIRVLPPGWRQVQGSDGEKLANPVRHHYPYLPLFAAVNVPFLMAADVIGITWDPRVLGWLAMVAALVVVARRPEPAWARLGVILGLGSAFSVVYLAWGTNDLFAASVLVLALCWAVDRPRLAGVALAVALSAKILLAVVLPPLCLAVVLLGGWAALKRWWTMPAVLVASCLPFLLTAPADFLDDTVWFNLGRSKPLMPVSGIGLPATAPGVMHGPLLALVTLIGLAIAAVGPLWAVRRWPSVWTAGSAAGIALLGLLVPARTFQANYLVLVAVLAPLAWLAVADHLAPALRGGDAVRLPEVGADPAT